MCPGPVAAERLQRAQASAAAARQPSPAPNGKGGDGSLSGPQQRILNSLATWKQIGEQAPTNPQVAWLAGYSPSSSSYANPRSALKTAGLIEYPSPDHVAITDIGEAQSIPIELQSSLLDFVVANLPGPEGRILKAIAAHFPNAVPNEAAASEASYSATSSSYANPRSSLKTKDLIGYPKKDHVAADWLFAA